MTVKLQFNNFSQLARLLLIVSIGIFTIGVVFARNSPASTYEISIYSATPRLFWAGILFIFVSCLYLPIHHSSYIRTSVLVLITAFLSIYLLPLIRGYYFVGEGDALSHFGTVNNIIEGTIDPLNLFYHNSHILSAVMSLILDMPVRRTLQLVPVVLVFIFIISILVSVRYVYATKHTFIIPLLIGMSILPLGQTGLQYIPNLLSRLYISFAILVLLILIVDTNWRSYILNMFASLGLLFMHPQIFMIYVIILGTVSVSILYSHFNPRWSIKINNPQYIPYIFFSVLILLFIWVESRRSFIVTAESFVLTLIDPSPASSSQTPATSLIEIGGSLTEVFAKLFLPTFLTIFISSAIVISTVYRFHIKNVRKNQNNELVTWLLAMSCVSLFVVFLVSLISDTYYIRHLYASIVPVAILSSYGICQIYDYISKHRVSHLVTLGFLIILVLSTMLAFPSPYIYQANSHVPESQIEGYSTSFEHRDSSTDFVRVRSNVFRYVHATEGRNVDYRDYTGAYRAGVPDHFADQQLDTYYDEPKYLAVTGADRVRDPILYRGLRFTQDDLDYLDQNQRIHKINNNNQFDLYYIE
ncbi:hypothetical protein [Halorubrum gandharaense]